MYFYFSSDYPAALKFNGIYFGMIKDTVKSCNFESEKVPLVEVLPLNAEGAFSFAFIPDGNFLGAPPENVSVTDLKGGFLIKLTRNFGKSEFSIIAQEKYRDLIVTVFNENGVKLSLEKSDDFYAETLGYGVSSAKFERFFLQNGEFIAVMTETAEKTLNVYGITGKIQKVLEIPVSEYSAANGFSTTQSFKDMAKHKVTINWEYSGESFKEASHTVTHGENYDAEKLPDQLLPYAFLEEFMCGGDTEWFLGGNVKEKSGMLKNYLGNYIGVMPPPKFRAENEIGLIYSKSAHLYEVKYVTFQFENRKITNLKLSEK